MSGVQIEAMSFAKVNPRLKIKGVREDGYHLLDISYLTVNLADRLVFEKLTEERITVFTEADIPEKGNLCYRVAKELKGRCSPDAGVAITLTKRIPIGGGLGGGSSNAATTLICLNRLWDCGLSKDRLIEIGKGFGADIPFFISGGYQTARGTGSKLERKENIFRDRLIPLGIPPFIQLTSEVYQKYDQLHPDQEKGTRSPAPQVTEKIEEFKIENDLQEAAIRLHPELKTYLDCFKAASTIQTAGIAGSGSSIYGISVAGAGLEEIREELAEKLSSISREAKLIIARPVDRAREIERRA